MLILLWFFVSAKTLPWNQPMSDLSGSLTGPVMKSVAVIVIAGFGFAYAFRSQIEHILEHISSKVIALALGLGAGTFVTTLFAGGAVV